MGSEKTEIVEGYWRHWSLARGDRSQRLESESCFCWWEEVHRVVEEAPLTAVADLLCALADTAPSDEALAYLGAGPIENFLSRAGKDSSWSRMTSDALRRQSPALGRAADLGLW